jgi:hypothetical protein
VINQSRHEFVVSNQDKVRIESIITKVDRVKEQNDNIPIVELEYLHTVLSSDEFEIIERVFVINPEIYGFKGPYLGIEPVLASLKKVDKQPYSYKGEMKHTNIQYVPTYTYDSFQKMANAMQNEIGRKLIIDSGYRSNAYQAVVFLSILKICNFDVPSTIKRAAVPGYSEHCISSSVALDLQNVDGLPSDDNPTDFETTQEYDWLTKNANKFNFFMSYPKDNPYGLMFEPWHWRHIPTEKH